MTEPVNNLSLPERTRTTLLLVGVAAVLLCLIGVLVNHQQFFRSYLFAWLFWLGITLGSLSWVCIHHLVGGRWGRAIQRIAEVTALNLPLMFILFLPILFGMKDLFPWADPNLLAHDPVMQHRHAYMNPLAFTIRALIYFALWMGWAMMMARWSRQYDQSPSVAIAMRMRRFSAFGLCMIMATVTLASVDWIMSRETHWFSTIIGFIMVVGQALSGLLFLVVVLTLLVGREPLKGYVTRGHYNDLGNLLLTLVILWAYVAFAQFLVSWTGNIQEEVKWYNPRMHGAYGAMGALLIIFHFLVPFLLLLSKRLKRQPELLARLAAVLLAVRMIDIYWMVAPSNDIDSLSRVWLNIVAPIAIGTIWIIVFLRRLARTPLLAVSEHEGPSAMLEHDADPQVEGHGHKHAHPV